MNLDDESLYWFWFCNIEGIGNESRRRLLQIYGKPKDVFLNVSLNDLTLLKIREKSAINLINSRKLDIVYKCYEKLVQKEISVITLADEEYPKRLRNIFNPPGVLYLRGKLPKEEDVTIAIVGARDCSNYGKELAKHFAYELSKKGIQIISGLAKGIDSYAHCGAIGNEGNTYAVLGCGIDICYPRENIQLYMDILNSGGILSEYNIGLPPLQGNFPLRNRIISGLSDGILLVEARERSGSLITMEHGLEQGKNIYACPGRIFDSLSIGTNQIIQQGGKLVLSAQDIFEDFGIESLVTGRNLKKNNNLLERDEKMVYDRLSLMPKYVEELKNETGFDFNHLSEVLLQLQMKGHIKQIAGNYYSSLISTEDTE